jgi:hypothetical protein
MNKNVDHYLKYLNEGIINPQNASKAGKFIGSEMKSAIKFSLLLTPSAWLSWRSLSGSLSKATRKCGTFGRNTAGRQSCIARERIKIYDQKVRILKSSIGNCKDDICKQKVEIEIEKLNNKIFREKSKLKEILGEVAIIPFLGVMAIGSVIDKGIFLAWRSALALFSSASRKCGAYKNGPEREICMSKIKLQSLAQQQNIISKVKASCNKSKNPQKCFEKMDKKYGDIIRKVQMLKDNITASKHELDIKRQEDQLKSAKK